MMFYEGRKSMRQKSENTSVNLKGILLRGILSVLLVVVEE